MFDCSELIKKEEKSLYYLKKNIEASFSSPDVEQFIYTLKSRIKDPNHLNEKIKRKEKEGKIINEKNLYSQITDLVGLRVIILYPQYFKKIHDFIISKIQAYEWELYEDPILYVWDEDTKKKFESEMGFKNIQYKQTLYTSVHYVVKIKNELSSPYCEIQVRTLLEEVFGEIDHDINYPVPSKDDVMVSQLQTLSKMVAAASKLTETIYLHNSLLDETTITCHLDRNKNEKKCISNNNRGFLDFIWYILGLKK